MMFSLTDSPIKSFFSYQFILHIVISIIIVLLSFIFDFNLLLVYLGFLVGTIAISIGFVLLVFSVDKILQSAKDEKQAKTMSLLFFILRYAIYLGLSGVAITFFKVNILSLILGFFTLRIVIYIDHFVNRNGGV